MKLIKFHFILVFAEGLVCFGIVTHLSLGGVLFCLVFLLF